MPTYLLQGSYSAEAWSALIKNPQDRTASVRQLVERFGGTLTGWWLALGEYDFVLIADLPDEVSVSACMMATMASGGFKRLEPTLLIKGEDAVKAMTTAGSLDYKPPTTA